MGTINKRSPPTPSPLKELREAAGLTQRQVAEKIGVNYQSYQRYENGKQIPNAVLACKIAKVVGTTVESIWND